MKNREIAVSVIIPMYNCAAFLPELMESLTHQTLKDIEIICVDDGSADDTLKQVQKYAEADARIQVYHEENAGAGCARNLGIEHATGKYLMFLDSDDKYSTELVESMYRCAEEYKADFVGCNFIREDLHMGTEEVVTSFTDAPENEAFCLRDLVKGGEKSRVAINPLNKLYRRAKVLETGERFNALRSSNDIYFVTVQAFSADRVVYLPHSEWITVQRYASDDSITSNRAKTLHCAIQAELNVLNWLQKQEWYDAAIFRYWCRMLRGGVSYNAGFGYNQAFCEGVEHILDLPIWRGMTCGDMKKSLGINIPALQEEIDAAAAEDLSDPGKANRLQYLQNQMLAQQRFNAYIEAHFAASDEVRKLQEENKRLQEENKRLRNKKQELLNQKRALQTETKELQKQLRRIERSRSYRIGRRIMWLPYKLKGVIGKKGGTGTEQ